jgi:hypothetical protein
MYVKVFSDIIQSSIWAEDAETCKVWITMLALANQDGLVRATAPGISNEARVPIEKTRQVLALLEAPDSESRTPDNEGRRIERIDGGYLILNYPRYRDMRDEEKRREQGRKRAQAYRNRHAGVTQNNAGVTTNNAKQKQKHIREDQGSSFSETENPSSEMQPPKQDELPKLDPVLATFPCDGNPASWDLHQSYRNTLKKLYPSLDLTAEVRKAYAWIDANPGKRKTARGMKSFLTNWLNKATNR